MKILVIAPHPDDEVLGCGGTIANHAKKGDYVFLCIVTKGYPPDWSEKFLKNRPKEVKKANKILGIKKTYFLDFPTVKLDTIPQKDLNEAISKVVNEVGPDTVYIPHRGDVNKDHRLVFEAAMVALRPKSEDTARKVLSYETLSETEWAVPPTEDVFVPGVYVDISHTLKTKLRAMSVYKSELKSYPHPRSLESITALAKKRGTEAGLKAAETFMFVREILKEKKPPTLITCGAGIRKIAVITGTRAEYGIFRPVLKAVKAAPQLKLALIVTGMHLSEEFGLTAKEIEKDGFKINANVEMLHAKDTGSAMARSIGKCVNEMANVLESIKPDILLILGDRAEMLASAAAASYMGIPIAHLHGGEVSGGVDEPVRHAISKLAHIHLPATEESAKRLIKMGEDPSRIFVVGAPALDTILNEKLPKRAELAKKYGLDQSKPILLVIQHPIVTEADEAAAQIKETLSAVVELKQQTILIYPNADAGGRRMIKVIKKYEKYPFIRSFKSISYSDYFGLMQMESVMVGNSSSGIIEAPSFHLPVVNIGTRQSGRERSTNVIDVGYDRREIINAVKKALYDKKFRKKVRHCKNPYGDGKASQRIVKVLSKIKITPRLLQKRITY